MKNNLYYLGKVFDTFRLKGQIKVYIESWLIDFRCGKLNNLYLEKDGELHNFTLDKAKNLKNYWIFKLEKVNHIKHIESFKKAEIFIPILEYKKVTRQWYYPNILDYKLRIDNQELGYLKSFFRVHKQVVGEFVFEKKHFFLPMIPEYLISKDDSNKIIFGKKNILDVYQNTLFHEKK